MYINIGLQLCTPCVVQRKAIPLIVGNNLCECRSIFPNSLIVAAIQVVQVVRFTRAYDHWGPTSEDQIAFFEKLISSVSHVASHCGYCKKIVF